MRLLILAPVLATALVGASSALPAAAAPDNKNTGTFDVDCQELGEFTVTENLRGGENSGGVVFGPDGQVFVPKGFDVTFEGSIAIDEGPTINFPPETEVEEPKGKGYVDRLIECDFTQTFTDTFELTPEDVEFFELDESFIGAEATFTGTATGTAQVLAPGSK